jgi:hypothetical protein
MAIPERTRCILCGAEAERLCYGVRGWKYICLGKCPDYAAAGSIHYLLEMEHVFPADLRSKISDYLVSIEPNPDEYYVLRKEDIEKATGQKIL